MCVPSFVSSCPLKFSAASSIREIARKNKSDTSDIRFEEFVRFLVQKASKLQINPQPPNEHCTLLHTGTNVTHNRFIACFRVRLFHLSQFLGERGRTNKKCSRGGGKHQPKVGYLLFLSEDAPNHEGCSPPFALILVSQSKDLRISEPAAQCTSDNRGSAECRGLANGN